MKVATEQTESFGTASEEYVCIYPEEAQQVFDYLEGLTAQGKDLVHDHLHFCLYCREKVTNRVSKNLAIEDLEQIILDGDDNEIGFENREDSRKIFAGLAKVENIC